MSVAVLKRTRIAGMECALKERRRQSGDEVQVKILYDS